MTYTVTVIREWTVTVEAQSEEWAEAMARQETSMTAANVNVTCTVKLAEPKTEILHYPPEFHERRPTYE